MRRFTDEAHRRGGACSRRAAAAAFFFQTPLQPPPFLMKEDVEAPTAPLVLIQQVDTIPDDRRFSLRRAATALLIFSILGLRHLSGWLGLFAACTVLCSATSTLRARTCRVRVAASFAAGFAIVGFAACIACVVAGMPQHLSREIQKECYSMPADTFEWGKQAIANFDAGMDKSAHLNEIVHDDEPKVAGGDHVDHHHPEHSSEHHEILIAWYSPHRMLKSVATLVAPEQKQMCNHVAQFVADWGSMLLLAGAFVEWGLFVSAVIVALHVRRLACRSGACAASPAVIVASPVLSESTSA